MQLDMNSDVPYNDTTSVPLPIPIPRPAKSAKMTVATPKPATQPPPTAQPPSLASLSAMHQSTVTTLVDLFNLALTHPSGPSGASDTAELDQARERIRQLEVELATSKAHEKRDVVSRKAEQVSAVEPQFVAVLLDGDGAIFNSDFLKQGAAGGHEAAKLLLSSLPAFIASTAPPEVAKHATRLARNAVVNVIVNKFGLAGAVVKAGIVSSFSTVADFFLAFSQAHSNINVIDSGPGKEASDSKIHAQLHFYSSLPSCGLTILAGSHDAGYGNVLRSLVTEGRNVVLLRGGHTAWLLEGICPAGEIEGLFMPGKVPTLSGVGGAVGTGMPSPAPLGGAGRPVMVNGRKTEEARLQEIESARDKKRMRRRLRRQEERERKEAEEHERNDKALQDDSDYDDDEDEVSARAPHEEDTDDELILERTDDDVWQDTDGSVAADGEADDPADILAKQFAGVRIRNPQEYRMMTKLSSSLATPTKTPAQGRSVIVTDTKARATQEGVQSKRKNPTQRKAESESDSSSSSDDDDDDDQPISRPTPKQPNKTPQQAISRPKPQSWEALVNTPSGKPGGGGGGGEGKQTPRAAIGMTPKTPGRYAANADRGEENSIPVQGAERALRYLNPRPCHKHYLDKDGCSNKSCAFSHQYLLNQGQLQYLRKLAKEMPCPWLKLGRCSYDDQTCIYGHKCPHADSCLYGSSCRFNELPDGGHNGKGDAAIMM